ncbi:MAG: hypothetical protein FJ011_07040 [Chloroflexi bacterium]|nr:hypothetical protein [Chloroflexota bacterium]
MQEVDFEKLVGPLQDNGGPTYTRALLPGSPAIDTIPIGVNGCEAGLSADQQGAPRAGGANQGGAACDSGAYEAASAVPVTRFPVYLPLIWR